MALVRMATAPAEAGAHAVGVQSLQSVGGDALSPDGKWYAYRIARVDADGELRYRRADRDDSARVVPLGLAPSFTRDSKYLAWFVEPSIKEHERLTKEKKPVQQNLTLLTLASGEKRTYDAVRAFTFAPGGDSWRCTGTRRPRSRGRVRHFASSTSPTVRKCRSVEMRVISLE